ncbi:sensor histidine kinase [Streptomyces sp. NPDC050548]|uniref:sensor histidine kinase n=1 Tax=Streptomyces sp. NPDC050548 TaxID=3365629 RepID=UPI0037AF935B
MRAPPCPWRRGSRGRRSGRAHAGSGRSDTFDAVLARLEGAFEAQKQFVANASHELRTPLTLQQAIVDVTLADPDASAQVLRAALGRVRAPGQEQERLIDALLTLARSQRGLGAGEFVDLAAVAGERLKGVELSVRHNLPVGEGSWDGRRDGGRVRVRTRPQGGLVVEVPLPPYAPLHAPPYAPAEHRSPASAAAGISHPAPLV